MWPRRSRIRPLIDVSRAARISDWMALTRAMTRHFSSTRLRIIDPMDRRLSIIALSLSLVRPPASVHTAARPNASTRSARRQAMSSEAAAGVGSREIVIEVLRYRSDTDLRPVPQRYRVPFTNDMSVLQGLQYIKDHLDG